MRWTCARNWWSASAPACRSSGSASGCRRCLKPARRRRRCAGVGLLLGICLGLQALFEASEEAPEVRGLGLFAGTVRRFSMDARVPHMGWNELEVKPDSKLVRDLPGRPFVYFAHSYYVPVDARAAAICTYAAPYTAALEAGNVFGVQFHPEKSGPVGLKIVRNFVEM